MEAGIRILLADDHPALRLGLRGLLEQAPEVEEVKQRWPMLTEREGEALALVAKGESDSEIAHTLKLTEP